MVEKLSPPSLAKLTVETYLKNNNLPEASSYKVEAETEKAGTFVCIKTKSGDLRGCIGTILPTKDTIEEEIIQNAISASQKDNRFQPVTEAELDNLVYSVDVLQAPVPVKEISELDPLIYGIIVRSNSGKQALLLPALDGIDTIETQIAVAKRKGGIPMEEPIQLYKFKVDRYKGSAD